MQNKISRALGTSGHGPLFQHWFLFIVLTHVHGIIVVFELFTFFFFFLDRSVIRPAGRRAGRWTGRIRFLFFFFLIFSWGRTKKKSQILDDFRQTKNFSEFAASWQKPWSHSNFRCTKATGISSRLYFSLLPNPCSDGSSSKTYGDFSQKKYPATQKIIYIR